MEDLVSRVERFASVGSTNDVVRDRLTAGAEGRTTGSRTTGSRTPGDRTRAEGRTPDPVVVVADEQTAGRGRDGRTWTAPPGRALLLSIGFRPTWLAPTDAWRLAATVSLAMADAAEEVAGLRDGTVRLKWPNDLVAEVSVDGGEPEVRKLGGVLGETAGLGSDDPIAIVGIGVNADWPAIEFPRELARAMTSLREASGGRPIDREALLVAFLDRLEVRLVALRDGRFDGAAWLARQLTNGRLVRLDLPDGTAETVRALAVDPRTGALLVEDPAAPGGERPVTVGEITHLRAV